MFPTLGLSAHRRLKEGTKARPGVYSDDYGVVARETAYARVTLAGYRLMLHTAVTGNIETVSGSVQSVWN